MTDGISTLEVDGFRNAVNGHTLNTILALVTDDVAIQDEFGGARSGKSVFGQFFKNWFGGFPNMTVAPRATTIQGWSAVVEVTVTGTNTGQLTLPDGQVLAATNRSVKLEGAWALRFNSAGKLAGLRIYNNPSKLLAQLGVATTATGTTPP